ncbi:MAG: nuclease-related domain-containing protein [Pseudomonadota bacterium]
MVDEALQQLDTEQSRLILAVVATVMFLGLVYFVWRAWRQRRERAKLHQSIVAVGTEALCNVLVPDGMGAAMHVDYLLLTSRGVLVIDLRDLRGNIFGGDQMTDWTVMNGPSRTTFPNPQHALYDRVAAVRQLSGDLAVEGRILFTRRGRFPKGLPRWTLMVDSLHTEFPLPDSDAAHSWVGQYRDTWQRLSDSVSPSPLRQPRGFLADVFTT